MMNKLNNFKSCYIDELSGDYDMINNASEIQTTLESCGASPKWIECNTPLFDVACIFVMATDGAYDEVWATSSQFAELSAQAYQIYPQCEQFPLAPEPATNAIGTRCAVCHEPILVTDLSKCVDCGAPVCEDCIAEIDGHVRCPHCASKEAARVQAEEGRDLQDEAFRSGIEHINGGFKVYRMLDGLHYNIHNETTGERYMIDETTDETGAVPFITVRFDEDGTTASRSFKDIRPSLTDWNTITDFFTSCVSAGIEQIRAEVTPKQSAPATPTADERAFSYRGTHTALAHSELQTCECCGKLAYSTVVWISVEAREKYNNRRKTSKSKLPGVWLCRTCWENGVYVDFKSSDYSSSVVLSDFGRQMVMIELESKLNSAKAAFAMVRKYSTKR